MTDRKKSARLNVNPSERVCTLGALVLQYIILGNPNRVNDLMDQLSQNDRDRLLIAAFDLCKSLSNKVILDRMVMEGDVKQVKSENDRLVRLNDTLISRMRGAGLVIPTDLETN